MKQKFAIACLLLALLGAGCSSTPWFSNEAVPDPTAELLFKEGTDFFNRQKYVLAIDRFQKVKTDFPFSPLLTDAELKLAETYYKNEQYPEAITAFKEFQAMHPTNENIPFVLYHLGMAHFAQFTTIDRDQKMTEIAKGYFETLVKNHPKSPYADEAKKKLAKCSEYLAEHEFNIAAFYMREKNYPAARDRLEGIVREYPNTPAAAKSVYHLGQTYQNEKNNVKASLAYEALLQYYPDSPFTKEAKNRLVKLEKEKQDPLAVLLQRDGRPFYLPPAALADGNGQATGLNKEKMPDLFAKKEVVYEEPGSDKGIFRRVVDTLNPFSSSSDENEPAEPEAKSAPEKIETANDDSGGFFGSLWSSLNPFSSKEKNKEKNQVVVRKDARLMEKVDESLKEKGVEAQDGGQISNPPAPDLPQIAEVGQELQPPAADPAEVLEKVDSRLHQEGKDTDSLPPIPNISPVFQASSTEKIQKAEANTKRASSEVLTGIDQALQQKGIEVPEIKVPEKPTSSDSGRSAVNRPANVELDTDVEFKKGPLFLESGEYKVKEKAEESERQETEQSPVDTGKLPESVVTGPSQLEKKNPTEKKTPSEPTFEEEEDKGAWEQISKDFEDLNKALNPFNW